MLPADSFAEGPPSGHGIRGRGLRTAPFESQPVQGVSGLVPLQSGRYLALLDNGFGARENSADFLLRCYEIQLDFGTGAVEPGEFVGLSDPQGFVPFPIVRASSDRLLTGADFDPESFCRLDDGSLWIGDEFGPFLLHVDAEGRLLQAPVEVPVPAAFAHLAQGPPVVRSPSHPAVLAARSRRETLEPNLPGSGGFEGLALHPDGRRVIALLEKGLIGDDDPRRRLLLEFDLERGVFSERWWNYPVESAAHSIGELSPLSGERFLVIERDDLQGAEARFKRIFAVDLGKHDGDRRLFKEPVVDLLDILDERGLTRAEDGHGLGREFRFPFVTIEAVVALSNGRLLVCNDNNYPFSRARRPPATPDGTEFIQLRLPRGL